ncbi:MAG: DUF998 domain-containing protein [Bacteroidetes bacterium]|jgi:hypothetical membrane protein|nr:DUF998 domain-containing protein [Bacteroidota bacterium]
MIEPDASDSLLSPRTSLQTALLCSGVAGAVLFTTVYFCFGVISPNYYMIHESVSRLQLQPYGWIQSLNYIISGLLICAFAIALRKELVSGFGSMLIPFFHFLTGLGSIILGVSLNHQVQLYAGGIIFLSLITGLALFTRRFSANPQWHGWTTYTILTVLLMIALCILFTYYSTQKGSPAGVFERLIIITRLVWIFFFTSRLLGGRSIAPMTNIDTKPAAEKT